ncbi:MAG: hypothetical protein K2M94_01250 [Paramuribaculum sp.]|nr:hypothetical protein [Paramuribaculum sp.]
MKRLMTCICLLTVSLLSGAKEITIIPQFTPGDTLRYRTTAQVIMYHANDSLVSTTKMLPKLIVKGKNDKGFVIATSNQLESFNYECSDAEAKDMLMSFDKTEILNDFVASIVLRIQLGADCRPDSVLNIDEVKETIIDAYINMIAKEQGIDVESSAEWIMDTKPLIIGAVSMMCTPKHLIEEQFGNVPYFNFIGVPLESGKIPATMVLTYELQNMYPDLTELDMEIHQLVNTAELNMAEDDGFYSIRINGKNGKSEVEGQLLFARGLLNHGWLSITSESDYEKTVSNFIIDKLP